MCIRDSFDTTTGRHFGNLSATKPPHTVAKPVVQQATNYQYQAPNVIPPRARSANINPRLIDPNVRHRTSNVQQAAYQYPATNPPTTGFQATAPRIGFQAQPVAAQNFGQFPNGFHLTVGSKMEQFKTGRFQMERFKMGQFKMDRSAHHRRFCPEPHRDNCNNSLSNHNLPNLKMGNSNLVSLSFSSHKFNNNFNNRHRAFSKRPRRCRPFRQT